MKQTLFLFLHASVSFDQSISDCSTFHIPFDSHTSLQFILSSFFFYLFEHPQINVG